MNNAKYTCKNVYDKCKSKLKHMQFETEGKHIYGRYRINGDQLSCIAIPHGRKTVKPGTYANMARQLKLAIWQFDELLDCKFSGEDYQGHLTPSPSIPHT